MEKTLRTLGLAAVIGCVAVVAAQVASGPGTQEGRSRQEGGAVASGPGGVRLVQRTTKHPGPHLFEKPNAVQQQIRYALTGKQNLYIEQAKADGREEIVAPLIKVNCYSTLTLMRPDEQLHEMHDVWQVDVWVPDDAQWAAVCRAPSMVEELTKVSPAVCAKVQAEADRLSAIAMAPYTSMMKRLNADPSFRKSSREDQIAVTRAENNKLYAGRSKVELASENAARCDKVLAFIRPLLNKAQVAEFDRIKGLFDEGVVAAQHGNVPPYLQSK